MKASVIAFSLALLLSCQSDDHPDAHVAFTPQTVVVDSTDVIYYELDVTNLDTDTLYISSLQVFGDGEFLMAQTWSPIERLAAKLAGRLKDITTIYVELPVGHLSDKIQLTHRLTATWAGGITSMTFETDPIEVAISRPIIIGAPLGGGTWAAIYNPLWERGHRRMRFGDLSKEFIPGRFAIDFIMLDSSGRYAEGDENQIANWFGYGSHVLAVADGVVVGGRDDFSESPTLDKRPEYQAEQATGNYIAIEIAKSVVVFYEHLKPGSVKVTKGQRVNKGDVIAALGFTGQSTGPHLHLHLANDSLPLFSEGIAFVFDEFELAGRYSDFSEFGKERWQDEPAIKKLGERPPVNSVVRFGLVAGPR